MSGDPNDLTGHGDRDDGRCVELGATAAVAVLFLMLRMPAVAHWDWHVVATTMTLTFANPWTLVGIAAFTAIVVALRLIWRHGLVHDALTGATRPLWVVAAMGILLLAALNDVPWMGEETILTDNGPIDGYVLDAEPGFLHVLTEDRQVIVLPDDIIVSRRLEE